MAKELWQRSGVELGAAYASGEYTPVDVLEAVLQRIERVNPIINAFVSLDSAGARQSAEASAKRWQTGTASGPLDGAPISVKDNIIVGGLRSTWGSKLYSDFVPKSDELPIGRLRSKGAIILGKTNCPEFTLQGYTDNLLFGVTRNPWDLELTPGGSSGGAVAAVAAGLGPVAVGTDADGFPVILIDCEVIGPVARTVADTRALFHALAGTTAPAPAPVRQLRVLYV